MRNSVPDMIPPYCHGVVSAKAIVEESRAARPAIYRDLRSVFKTQRCSESRPPSWGSRINQVSCQCSAATRAPIFYRSVRLQHFPAALVFDEPPCARVRESAGIVEILGVLSGPGDLRRLNSCVSAAYQRDVRRLFSDERAHPKIAISRGA